MGHVAQGLVLVQANEQCCLHGSEKLNKEQTLNTKWSFC